MCKSVGKHAAHMLWACGLGSSQCLKPLLQDFLGLRVYGQVFKVKCLGFRVEGLGCWVFSLGFGVWEATQDPTRGNQKWPCYWRATMLVPRLQSGRKFLKKLLILFFEPGSISGRTISEGPKLNMAPIRPRNGSRFSRLSQAKRPRISPRRSKSSTVWGSDFSNVDFQERDVGYRIQSSWSKY